LREEIIKYYIVESNIKIKLVRINKIKL